MKSDRRFSARLTKKNSCGATPPHNSGLDKPPPTPPVEVFLAPRLGRLCAVDPTSCSPAPSLAVLDDGAQGGCLEPWEHRGVASDRHQMPRGRRQAHGSLAHLPRPRGTG